MSKENPFSLEGKTALVAGASRGIGLAIAEAVARAGAHTILAARSMEKLESHAARLREEGCSAEARLLDVSSLDSIRALARELPPIDVLHNVSGINRRKRFLDYTEEDYDTLLNTNLKGLFFLTQEVGRGMVERGRGGSIVHIGSLMSLLGFPHLTIYAVTKSGLAGLTRTLAAEWGEYNIRVNCIAPGFIITDLNREIFQREDMHAWVRASQAVPHTGAPEDVAALALFLSADASAYITGQVMPVDGGFTTTGVWPFQPPKS
jgi:NAD(P)-dependent dehydrogenase (short-subunit alcohol dehydrogenase family)